MPHHHRVRRVPARALTGALLLVAGLLFSPAPNLEAQYVTRAYDATNDPAFPSEWADRDWSDDIPAHIAVVDGSAWLERDGYRSQADENTPLLAGDRLETDRGRVDILFGDGSALDLDERTDVELLSESLIRLHAGQLRLTLARANRAIDYRVDAGGTTTTIHTAGDYRVALRAGEVRLTVIRGFAELGTDYGRTMVQSGHEAAATERRAPSLPYAVNTTSWDSFEHWVDARARDRYGDQSISAAYLPADIRYYGGVLDRYGSWERYGSYGYVWYPRVVADWRPYYDGRWSVEGSFGWFWIGATNWSWPTHHYGRWGNNAGRWYWIPDNRWAPAWVSWASTPDYITWCALGYDNRPVYRIAGSVDAWRGWTVIPSRSFAGTVSVRRVALNGRTALPRTVRFTERPVAPVRPTGVRGLEREPLRAPSTTIRTRTAQPRDAGTRVTGSSPRATVGERMPAANGASAGTPRVYSTPRTASPRGMGATNASRGPATDTDAGRSPERVVMPRAPQGGAAAPRTVIRREAPSDQPRNSAPERRIDSRPPPRSSSPDDPPSSTNGRVSPSERRAPPPPAPSRPAETSERRTRGANSDPAPERRAPAARPNSDGGGSASPGPSNGRTAPSESGSSRTARGRSR